VHGIRIVYKERLSVSVTFITDSDMVKIGIRPPLKKGLTSLRPKDILAEKK
jgi:hypothetical protein